MTITLQPSTQDTYADEYNPTTIHGADTTMGVRGRVGRNNISYVEFDLSSLVGETIVSAVMHLWVEAINDIGTPYPSQIDAVRCTSVWDEDTLDWSPQPTISGTPLKSIAWHKTAGVWVTFDPLDLTEFGLMIATNYGMRVWIPAGDEGGNNWVAYATKENATATHRPKLVVEILEAAGTTQVVWIM